MARQRSPLSGINTKPVAGVEDSIMNRRAFLHVPLAGAILAAPRQDLPAYRVVTPYQPSAHPGMPGAYSGKVVSVHSAKSIDEQTGQADPATVREMIARGMTTLTGDTNAAASWRKFFEPADVVGIKVNCSGAPHVCSNPVVVAEIVQNLVSTGVKPTNIFVYERFPDQLTSVNYPKYLPQGVNVVAIEMTRKSIAGYDPRTYVEVDFFGEDDTRSNLIRLVSNTFTKVINVPNMKDHGAAGVTGCLKNIAYGNFSNVARSHRNEKTNTLSFIGTLASVEPLRSKTVLQIMDGLKGVWHGGPFVRDPRFAFYPKQILIGTDPVAIDRQLIDVIEAKRREEGAPSVWDRSMQHVSPKHPLDPNYNAFIREPGHIEFAGGLGLGVYDQKKIANHRIEVA
jgi:uncharacterized protein (DUF362 family)